jgi:hypothetical protein
MGFIEETCCATTAFQLYLNCLTRTSRTRLKIRVLYSDKELIASFLLKFSAPESNACGSLRDEAKDTGMAIVWGERQCCARLSGLQRAWSISAI